MARATDSADRCDALVLFGATGDLARKKIFPAVYEMQKAGRLGIPVIGVASSAGDDDFIRERARKALEEYDPTSTPTRGQAAERSDQLRVGRLPGAGTSTRRLAERLEGQGASRCSTWPSRPCCSTTWSTGSRAVGLTDGARVVVEKPFGRDRRPARELNECLHRAFPENVDLPDRPLPRQGVGREPARVPLRQLDARAGLEPQLHLQHPDHDGRGVRRRQPRQVLRERRGAARRRPEPPAADRRLAGHGAAGRRRRDALRDEKVKLFKQIRTIDPNDVVRGQYRDYSDEPGVDAGSDVETFVALKFEIDSWRWAGRAVADPDRQGAADRPPPRRSSSSTTRRACCSRAAGQPRPDAQLPALPARQGRRRSCCTCTPRRPATSS